MADHIRPQLGRAVVTPFATIGVLAAVLMWEVEHVESILLAGAVAMGAIAVGILVARRVRRRIDELAKYYETLLRTAEEQSQRAETANELKNEFLATVSHELRTPLTSIIGWTRLLATGKLDTEHREKALRAIERGCLSQSRVVDDLLDISRIVGGGLHITVKPVLVPPIVTSAIESLQPAADAKRILVSARLDASIGLVAVDPDRLRQIVWNLLSNGIKFTPSGGCVQVSAGRSGDQLVLSVSDTGIGFHPSAAARLFERFHQGDASATREYGGLGLGLGIVRHLVELHGGTVTAKSHGKNQGAQFTVRLPIRLAADRSGHPERHGRMVQAAS